MSDPTIVVGETSDGPLAPGTPGHPVEFPVEDVLQGRGFVTGKSGSGKSNTVSVVVEELLDAGFPVLLFDADGEYVSLKEEYEILHVGAGEYCERVVGPDHADALAELGISQREPIILDLAGYAEDEMDAVDDEPTRDEMIAAVAGAFFNRASQAKRNGKGVPYLLVAEEIHEFVPQQGGISPGGAKLVKVAKRGRSRGLGVVGVSQRPADVDKGFITQCDWLVWHRLTWNNDTKQAGQILGSKYEDPIETLGDGEAFVLTDWSDTVERVQFRRRRTTDLGQAPGIDGVADIDLKETDTSVLDELDDAVERARSKQDQIDYLKEQLEAARAEGEEWKQKYEDAEYLADVSAEVTSAQLSGLFSEAGADVGDGLTVDTTTVELNGDALEVPEVIEAEVLEIREEKRELETANAELREENERLRDRVETLEGRVERVDELEARLEQAEAIEERLELAQAVLAGEAGAEDVPDGGSGGADGQRRVGEYVDEADHSPLKHEAIQIAIDEAKADTSRADEHVDTVLSVLDTADGDGLSAGEVATPVSFSETTAREVLKALDRVGVVATEGERPKRYRIDEEFLEQRIRVAERQAEMAGGSA